jgi:hypothetical protein
LKEHIMAKTNTTEKIVRTSKLLWGMRHPAIAAQLASFGFKAAVLDEGWAAVDHANALLLARVVSRAHAAGNSEIVSKLDTFENRWFPIVKNALRRRYPDVAEQFFANLGRSDGSSASVVVRAFIGRLAALENGVAPFGAAGPEAREYLRERGLTDAIVAEAALELEARKDVAETVVSVFDKDAFAKAEAEVWAFYLDWGHVVRSVITDGNLLRLCGFKKRSGGTRKTTVTPVEVAASSEGENPEDVALNLDGFAAAAE